MTVPDDALSIKQILAKHVNGMKIAEQLYRTPVYDSGADFDSPDLEEVQRMDMVDRAELAELTRLEVEKKKADLQAAKKAIEDKLKQKDPKDPKKPEEASGEEPEVHERKAKKTQANVKKEGGTTDDRTEA